MRKKYSSKSAAIRGMWAWYRGNSGNNGLVTEDGTHVRWMVNGHQFFATVCGDKWFGWSLVTSDDDDEK